MQLKNIIIIDYTTPAIIYFCIFYIAGCTMDKYKNFCIAVYTTRNVFKQNLICVVTQHHQSCKSTVYSASLYTLNRESLLLLLHTPISNK